MKERVRWGGKDRTTEESTSEVDQLGRVPLGRLLIDAGLSKAQVDDALAEGRDTGERLGEVVVRRGLLTEDDVARVLAQQWDLEYVERSAIWFDAGALARLARGDAQRLEALPTRVEDGRVVVALAEPTEQRLASLRELLGEETIFIVVPKSALDAGLRSDLLPKTVRPGPAPAVERKVDESHAEPAEQADLLPEATPGLEPEPVAEESRQLAPVIPFPLHDDGAEPEPGADSASRLADEAQALAERLSAQVATVRAQQQELRDRSAEYERRIAQLEEAVQHRTGHLDHLRGRLAQLLESLDGHAVDL